MFELCFPLCDNSNLLEVFIYEAPLRHNGMSMLDTIRKERDEHGLLKRSVLRALVQDRQREPLAIRLRRRPLKVSHPRPARQGAMNTFPSRVQAGYEIATTKSCKKPKGPSNLHSFPA